MGLLTARAQQANPGQVQDACEPATRCVALHVEAKGWLNGIAPKCIGRSQAQFINLFEEILPDSLKVLSKYSVKFQCPVISINQLAREGLAEGTRIDVVIRAMAKVRVFVRDDLPDIVRELLHVPAAGRKRMSKLIFSYICDYNELITVDDIQSLETETQEKQQVVNSAVEVFRVEGIQEAATNLLHKGMRLEEVVEVTKLSRDQIETLRQKINGAFQD